MVECGAGEFAQLQIHARHASVPFNLSACRSVCSMLDDGAGDKVQGANALMLWVPRNQSSAPCTLPQTVA